jgi:hypothetical protein
MLLIVILLLIAGWLRWPWWTPFGVLVLSAGLRIWSLSEIGAWQSNADLRTMRLAIGINFATTFVFYLLAHWAGRGLARWTGVTAGTGNHD